MAPKRAAPPLPKQVPLPEPADGWVDATTTRLEALRALQPAGQAPKGREHKKRRCAPSEFDREFYGKLNPVPDENLSPAEEAVLYYRTSEEFDMFLQDKNGLVNLVWLVAA